MAAPTTFKFGSFIVKVGDGDTPEVFAAPCGFTQRSLQFTANTNATQVPDCDDPDAPVWEEHDVTTMTAQVTGQGVLAATAHEVWREWFLSGEARNVRVEIAGATSYYSGKAILTNFQLDSEIGSRVTVNVNLQASGPWIWTGA